MSSNSPFGFNEENDHEEIIFHDFDELYLLTEMPHIEKIEEDN